MDITKETYNEIAEDYRKNWCKINVSRIFRKKFSSYVKKGRIADVGCGPGFDTYYFSKDFDVIGIDFSENMIKICRETFPELIFVHDDMRKIKFQENSMDGVWASQSLLNISKKECRIFLKEMKKCLKKGGIIFISFREGSFDGITDKSNNKLFSGRKRFVAMYEKDEMKKILDSLNYRIIEISKRTRKDGGEVYINVFAKNIK